MCVYYSIRSHLCVMVIAAVVVVVICRVLNKSVKLYVYMCVMFLTFNVFSLALSPVPSLALCIFNVLAVNCFLFIIIIDFCFFVLLFGVCVCVFLCLLHFASAVVVFLGFLVFCS